MWIEPLGIQQTEDGQWMVLCPNFFCKKRVQEQYAELLHKELHLLMGSECQLRFATQSNNHSKAAARKQQQLTLPYTPDRALNNSLLRSDFTFDQFVVGKNNGFAYAAALSLASQKKNHTNSLFLFSKTGLGKSHLSQAIGHHILSKNPVETVCYVTAEDFSNEMIEAFRTNRLHRFKEKYRKKCNVLLLEDIHYLSGKERTQVELAGALDSLFNADKKIIFSSCHLPGDIPKLNEKLRSRIACGLISTIDAPDFQTRLRILKKKAKACGYDVPEDVLHYLACELVDDVRQLKNGLLGVVTKASLLGAKMNVRLAESVASTIIRHRRAVTIDAIKKLVSTHYNIRIQDLESRSRKQAVVRPRQIAMYLARQYTDQPLQEIGRRFNRYHATALHSIHSVEKEISANSRMKQEVNFLRDRLDSGRF